MRQLGDSLELSPRDEREGGELRLVRGSNAVQRIFAVAGIESELSWIESGSG